ncbi:MAG: hypothetical protein KatS3mg113_0948 [Planctomycetaceae bacterium]|nr:MAG: hypothetical protein KatS3mg113_0948 [Planctomycetaceae bacterium]
MTAILFLETMIVGVIWTISYMIRGRLGRTPATLRVWIRRMSRHAVISCASVGAIATGLALTMVSRKIPVPEVHDEFAYLLAADTYAAGRLTNPTPPHPEHFETFHVLVRPTYASKFPPGLGLVLMAGKLIGGHPVYGSVILAGLAIASTCWMLRSWLPRDWAFTLSLWLSCNLVLVARWGTSYWGGNLSLLGSNLMWGAIPRFVRRPSVWQGLIAGMGIAIMSLSRPYEGMVATILGMFLLWGLIRRTPQSWWPVVCRGFIPAALPLAAALLFHARVYHAVTGTWWKLPYTTWQQQYAPHVPLFVWQPTAPPPLRNLPVDLQLFWDQESQRAQRQGSWHGYLEIKLPEVAFIILTLFDLFAFPLLLGWATAFSLPSWRLKLGVCSLAGISVLGISWLHAHYLASFLGVILAFVGLGLRTCYTARHFNGPFFVSLLLLAQLGLTGYKLRDYTQRPPTWADLRQSLEARLRSGSTKHLIFVSRLDARNLHEGWIHNTADWKTAPVLWVRDLGAQQNALLAREFPERRVWWLDLSQQHLLLRPYSFASSP